MAIPFRHSDPSRIVSTVRTFFVTSSAAGKRNLLQPDRAARLFIDVLYAYRAQQKYLLHAFVVMPDHFHVLITVGDISIERAVQFIKGGFAFRAGKELKFRSPVWERGFSETRVYDCEAAAQISDYIVQNPIRRGFAFNPPEYPYSSAYLGYELDDVPQGLKPPLHLPAVRHA